MLQCLSADHQKIVQAILNHALPPAATAWIFGSRATGNVHRASDLDLAIDAGRPLSHDELGVLIDMFEASDLPYKVEVVDYVAATPEFRKFIDRSKIQWPGARDA